MGWPEALDAEDPSLQSVLLTRGVPVLAVASLVFLTSCAAVAGTVATGATPMTVAADSGNHQVYVANRGDRSISVFDGSTLLVTLKATLHLTYPADAIAVDPATQRLG
jgi:DNA-binding beta-propeller fold protein YncE